MKTPLMRLLYATVLAVSMFAAVPAAHAQSVCYSTLGDNGCDPPDIFVPAGATLAPPGDFDITTNRAVTLVVSIQSGRFTGSATVSGGSVIGSGGAVVAASCAGKCQVKLPLVSGIAPGASLTARVRLFDPNGVTQEFSNSTVVLARMLPGTIDVPPGEFTATAWMLPPSSTTAFLRIVAPTDSATVTLYVTDSNGHRRGPVFVAIPAGGAVRLTSFDLERGNPAKGLPIGVGVGYGDLRVDASSEQPIRVFALATGLSELPVE